MTALQNAACRPHFDGGVRPWTAAFHAARQAKKNNKKTHNFRQQESRMVLPSIINIFYKLASLSNNRFLSQEGFQSVHALDSNQCSDFSARKLRFGQNPSQDFRSELPTFRDSLFFAKKVRAFGVSQQYLMN